MTHAILLNSFITYLCLYQGDKQGDLKTTYPAISFLSSCKKKDGVRLQIGSGKAKYVMVEGQ